MNWPRSAFLASFPRGAVVDEVQRAPQLPSYLRGVLDADPTPGRWTLTSSQDLALLESVSQSLAGRTSVLNLLPLAHSEVLRFERHPRTHAAAQPLGPRDRLRRLAADGEGFG